MSKEKILVAEQAPDISSLLKIYFTSQGYEVMTTMRGRVALELCRKTPPNLVLMHIGLPDIDGYEVGKALRASPRTRHIPIIFLSARGEKQDRLKGLGEVQAEYYIVKPFDIEEVHTIVKGALDRARQKNLVHPVTNLPTAELIDEQYRTLLSGTGWALAQLHINGFETFTQAYGAVVGEDVLKYTALLLSEVVNELGSPEDFIGQMVVGPDFIVTSTPEHLRAICEKLAERFDAEIGLHYNYKDRRNGYIVVNDENGNPRQVPLMSLSIGVLTSEDGPFYDIRELSETAEEARQKALAEARDQGRKSHVSYGRDGGISGSDWSPRTSPTFNATIAPSPRMAWLKLQEQYENVRAIRDAHRENLKARYSASAPEIRVEIDRLIANLNHDLGSGFGELQRAIKAVVLPDDERSAPVWMIQDALMQQLVLCNALHRTIIELGGGHVLQPTALNIDSWLKEHLLWLCAQIAPRLENTWSDSSEAQRLTLDPPTLLVACLHLVRLAHTAGANVLHISFRSAPRNGGLILEIEDDGASEQRMRALQSVLPTTPQPILPGQAQDANLLRRMLYLQDITLSCEQRPGRFRMTWTIPGQRPEPQVAAMTKSELRREIALIEKEIKQLEARLVVSTKAASEPRRAEAVELILPYVVELDQALQKLVRFAALLTSLRTIDPHASQRVLWAAYYCYLMARNLALALVPAEHMTEQVDINRQIDEVLEMLNHKLDHTNVLLDLDRDLPRASITAVDAKQVLLNVIKNAASAIEQGGIVHIKTAYRDHTIVITVEDTGNGIPKANCKHLFDRDFSTKGSGKNAGLGLYVAQSITARAGGHIRVASATLGKHGRLVIWSSRFDQQEMIHLDRPGALFQIVLPIAEKN